MRDIATFNVATLYCCMSYICQQLSVKWSQIICGRDKWNAFPFLIRLLSQSVKFFYDFITPFTYACLRETANCSLENGIANKTHVNRTNCLVNLRL